MEKIFIEKVGPNQEQGFTGGGRNVAGGTPAGARTGARGEGAAKARAGGK